jgi:hypothetical protein
MKLPLLALLLVIPSCATPSGTVNAGGKQSAKPDIPAWQKTLQNLGLVALKAGADYATSYVTSRTVQAAK